jgi:hypothetical protein
MQCPLCESTALRIIQTRTEYRHRRCKACHHAFFTFGDDICSKAEYHLAAYTYKRSLHERIALGLPSPRRRGAMKGMVQNHEKPNAVDLRPTLRTGHVVEETTPGVRVYRMKI